jgi:hypothetical protein
MHFRLSKSNLNLKTKVSLIRKI